MADPRSPYFNPDDWSHTDLHKHAEVWKKSAAETERQANDPVHLQQAAEMQNAHRRLTVETTACKKHGAGPEHGFDRASFPKAVEGCVGCKRAQGKLLKELPDYGTEATPADVKGWRTQQAEYAHETASIFERLARERTARTN
jgi:hypothetical protein